MTITEVRDKTSSTEFLEVPKKLYGNDANYIAPLDKDINAIFDPALNNFHSHGICKRWIAKNDAGELVGRIAAFINFKKNKDPNNVVGGIGFFESINDEKVAFELFDTAKQWLQTQNAKSM